MTQPTVVDRAALADAAHRKLAQLRLVDFAERMMPHLDAQAPHFRLVCEYLEALIRGEIQHLLLELPPRHSKTTIVSKLLVAYLVGLFERLEIILASNTASLAFDNSRVARNLVEDPSYPFNVKVCADASSMELWRTTNDCVVKAGGVGTAIQGRGADFLIVDDPIASAEDTSPAALDKQWSWFTQDAVRRLLPGGHCIVAMYRWSEADLAGRILEDPELAKQFSVLRLPVFAELDDPLGREVDELLFPRHVGPDGRPCGFTPAEINFQKQLDSWSFSAQYELNPTPKGGHFFSPPMFARTYTELPAPPQRQHNPLDHVFRDPLALAHPQPSDFLRVTAVDAAGKQTTSGSFSALVTLMNDERDYYVCDVEQHRVGFEALYDKVIAHLERWRPNLVVVENAVMGARLVGALQAKTRWNVKPVEPLKSKEGRAQLMLPAFEGQRVRLPTHAPWLDEMLQQLMGFPSARRNDAVDALVWALMMAETVRVNRRADEQLRAQVAAWSFAR